MAGMVFDYPPLEDVAAEYPPNTAVIRYQNPDGSVHDWAVGSLPTSGEQVHRDHLQRWKPDAVFLEYAHSPQQGGRRD